MADRYDPKLSLRSVGDRKAGDLRRDRSAQDDPLAELAKIVSGRSPGSSSSHASRAKPAPANDPAATPGGGDVLGDLETELLNDLQASFAAVRNLVDTPAKAAAAQPVPPAQTKPAPPPPPRREPEPEPELEVEPEGDPEPPFGAAFPATEVDLSDGGLPPARMAVRLAPEPPAAPPPPAATRPEARSPERRRPPPDAAPLRSEEPTFPLDPLPTRAPAGASDFGAYRPRSSEPPVDDAPAPPTARHSRSRWEKPAPAKPASGSVSRFAPPRSAPPPKSPVFDDDDLDPLADLVGGEDDEATNEFPLDGFGELQADDDDDGHEPPFPEGDLASLMEPRRSRTPLLVASVIGVVLIGGIAVAMFRPGGTDGAPPIIVADGSPTKITPDDTAVADAEAQNKLIYDRVNSGDGTTETTLLTNDEPIAAVPADDAANSPITRVIIPGGPGFDDPAAEDGLSLDGQPSTLPADAVADMAAGETDEPIQSIGPRRVRTVVVKPDGTIVESTASDVGADPVATDPSATVAALAVPEPAPPDTPATVSVEPPAPAPVTNDTAAIAGTGNAELQITPVPDIGGASAAVEEPAPAPVPNPPAAAVPAKPVPPAVASADTTAPIDLSQNAPIPAGGMLVQISSQRTEDAARTTFRDLQTRYPNILGSYDVNIQRAEIADRGTFYRVRVGPFSASDAQRLCNDLKSAGGDCILAQR